MKRATMIIALLMIAAGCGDNLPPPGAAGDAGSDAPGAADLTSFVIDLIKNHTADNTQPVSFDQFATLPDPDLNNADPKTGGYSSLFP
jgi:hypothetical protein